MSSEGWLLTFSSCSSFSSLLMLGIYFKELFSSVVLTLIQLFIVGILPQGLSQNFNKEDFKLIKKLLSLF